MEAGLDYGFCRSVEGHSIQSGREEQEYFLRQQKQNVVKLLVGQKLPIYRASSPEPEMSLSAFTIIFLRFMGKQLGKGLPVPRHKEEDSEAPHTHPSQTMGCSDGFQQCFNSHSLCLPFTQGTPSLKGPLCSPTSPPR